jgi:hypothetical protein
VFFDRLAYQQYVTLPQQINRQNAIDPVYHVTLKATHMARQRGTGTMYKSTKEEGAC